MMVVVFAGIWLSGVGLSAADYPDKPVNLIIGFAAGGETDTVVRALNDKLTANLGGQTVVLNKPGSGGLLAAQQVANAAPDGYNLLVLSLSHVLRQAADDKTPFNVLTDFEPVSRIVTQPIVLAVNKESPFQTIEQMIQYAKDNPNKLNFGSPGVGSLGHFSGELFKGATKISFKHVPFSGSAPSVTALMGGHIDFLVTALPAISGKVSSGDLRILASYADKRLPEMKEVPTFSEKGYPNVVMYGWFGFAAPAKTPPAIVQKLNQAVGRTIQDPGMEEVLKKLGFNPAYLTSAELKTFIADELKRAAEIAKRENIVIN
ncbi:MAG: tripartite tricarboxylate transporter substrate binding protein [Desulfobacterales bacterium]|nr:tripartite tricarboxylate transporter substrate binding protein [Desulfobacterales bacterium]